MKNKSLAFRSVVISFIVAGFSLLLCTTTQALVDKEDKTLTKFEQIRSRLQKSNYAPDEIIVKFKQETGPKITGNSITFSKPLGNPSQLNNLNATRFKIKKIQRLFGRLFPEGKTTIQQVQEMSKKFPQRASRAVKGEKVPDLENIYLIETENGIDIKEMAKEYAKDPNVEFAEPNYKVQIEMYPNDPYYSSQGSWGQSYDDLWGLKHNQMDLEEAWDIAQGKYLKGPSVGQSVIVAVVDTGVDYNHEDLQNQVIKGHDYVNDDDDPMDDNGHGTHVSGTIAAIGNNQRGIIGVAPEAKILALKGLDNTGSGWTSNLAQAIAEACFIYGADVINCSFGGSDSLALRSAVQFAHANGCVVVVAAGNDNFDADWYSPANAPEAITVAATTESNTRCGFSNYGPDVDVAAPGGNGEGNYYNILSLLSAAHESGLGPYILNPGSPNLYARLGGTSMAAPHVSGLAALVLSANYALSPEQVRQVIVQTADNVITSDQYIGSGRINAFKAVSMAKEVSSGSAKITAPKNLEYIRVPSVKTFTVKGTISGNTYTLEYAVQVNPLNWIEISQGSGPQVQADWNVEHLAQGHYVLRLTSYDSSGKVIDLCFVDIGPYMRISILPKAYVSPVVVADLDGDGDLEILAQVSSSTDSNEHYIYAYHHDGTLVQGWPVHTPGDYWQPNRSPSVGDVNGDGKVEVVYGCDDKIYVLTADGKNLSSVWPKQLKYAGYEGATVRIPNSIVLADFNGDGNLDIIYKASLPSVNVKVADVLDYRGESLPGWPKFIQDQPGTLSSGSEVEYITAYTYPPAVGDIDVDGEMEFVDPVFSLNGPSKIYVWHHDGTPFPKTPVIPTLRYDGFTWLASLILGNPRGDRAFIYYSLKEPYESGGGSPPGGIRQMDPEWGVMYRYDTTDYFNISLGEIVKTTYPYFPNPRIVGGDNLYGGTFFFFDPDAEKVVALNQLDAVYWSQPAIGNINADRTYNEVVVGTATGKIYAFAYAGYQMQVAAGFPIQLEGQILGTPALCDLNNDGKTEIVAAGEFAGSIYILYTDAQYNPEDIEWGMYQYDPQHTACYMGHWIPKAPSRLTAKAISGTKVQLYWQDNSTVETGVKIERKMGVDDKYVQVGTAYKYSITPGSFEDSSGLNPGTSYSYRIRAYKQLTSGVCTNSPYSNQVVVTTMAANQPPVFEATGSTFTIEYGTTMVIKVSDPNGDRISAQVLNPGVLPPGFIGYNPWTQTIIFNAKKNAGRAQYIVSIKLQDDKGAENTKVFTITVK